MLSLGMGGGDQAIDKPTFLILTLVIGLEPSEKFLVGGGDGWCVNPF